MFNKFKEDTTQLKDIEGLIKGKVNGRVIKHEVRPLTAFGENFGSEMLRVEITVEENGQEEVLHAVAKLIPPTELQMKIFNTQVTYKNETALLADIAPLLQDFQREHSFSEIADYFPKLYGARYSLKPNSHEVDIDAVILMENLVEKGYANINRFEGFDLSTAKEVLRALANFQSTAVVLKLKKPEVFASKIRPHLTDWIAPVFGDETRDPLLIQLEPYLKEHPSTAGLIPRVKKFLRRMRLQKVKKTREPWATIVHNDLWINNIMVKHTNHHVSGLKLVDFQIINYGSPVIDLIFFLFSSVQASVLRYHFDKLIAFYYNEFINTLKRFNVEHKVFSYESFQEELNLEAAAQINHALFMMNVVFGPKEMPKHPGKVPEWDPSGQVNALPNGSSVSNEPGKPDVPDGNNEPPAFPWPTACKESVWFILEEAAKRNWI